MKLSGRNLGRDMLVIRFIETIDRTYAACLTDRKPGKRRKVVRQLRCGVIPKRRNRLSWNSVATFFRFERRSCMRWRQNARVRPFLMALAARQPRSTSVAQTTQLMEFLMSNTPKIALAILLF